MSEEILENEDEQIEDTEELVVDDHFDESEVDVEAEVEDQPDAMSDMVDAVMAGDFSGATASFHNELNSRISDALEAEKMSIGQSFGVEQEYEDQVQDDEYEEDTVEYDDNTEESA